MFAFTCILYFAGALFRFFQAKQEKLNPFHSQPIGSPQSYWIRLRIYRAN